MPVLSISQAVRVEADGLIILPCPGGGRIIRRPVQFDRVYSIMTGLVILKILNVFLTIQEEKKNHD